MECPDSNHLDLSLHGDRSLPELAAIILLGHIAQLENSSVAGITIPLALNWNLEIGLKQRVNRMYKVPHLILVDDDDEVLQMLQLFFAPLDVTVTAFSNPAHALEYIGLHLNKIEGVLSDVQMHPFSGIELLKKIRALNATLPFYLMSADVSKQNIVTQATFLNLTGFFEKSAIYQQVKFLVDSLGPDTDLHSLPFSGSQVPFHKAS